LLSERYGTKKYFPEEDLQALLLGISSALSFLQEQGISHGGIHNHTLDICPAEIYFDASSSSFKILDSNLINGRASGM
jgi:serine/threonine protein kinase